MKYYFLFLIFIFGLTVGSYLNVLIYRLPRKIGTIKGTSFCPKCNHRLMPIDLVPLFSYLFLGGKCRYCKEKISPQYPFVEALNAILWVFAVLKLGFTVETIFYCGLFSCLIIVMFTDFKERIIPDKISLWILAFAVGLFLFEESVSPTERLIGSLCISVPMLILGVFGAMGGGDIKLMLGLGLALGWKEALLTTLLGSVLGSLAFFLLSKTRHSLGRYIPFGTFLSIGAIISVFFGEEIISWYVGLL